VVVGGPGPGTAHAALAAERVRGRRLARGQPRRLRRGRDGRPAAGRGDGPLVADRGSRRARTRSRG
jgi:hypothetical protein